jgi:hypothetical protein
MKLFLKKSFHVFFIICALLSLILQVEAHSGRTDSKGGHHDRSDGSYHYHHGYSAHDHYDMDGDGKKDCPYDFDDKTEHDSNSGSSISATKKDDKNSVTFWDVLKAMLAALLPTISISAVGFCILANILLFVFGEDKGWLITLVSSVILFVCSYIWLVIQLCK